MYSRIDILRFQDMAEATLFSCDLGMERLARHTI